MVAILVAAADVILVVAADVTQVADAILVVTQDATHLADAIQDAVDSNCSHFARIVAVADF